MTFAEASPRPGTASVLACASGLVFFLLTFVATIPVETQGPDPSTASEEDVARYYRDQGAQVRAMTLFMCAGWVAFIWFAAALYVHLGRRDPYLAAAALATGVATALLHILGFLADGAPAFEDPGSYPPGALAAQHAMGGSWLNMAVELGTFLRGAFLVAVGWGLLHGRVLPRWLGWSALVLGGLAVLAGFVLVSPAAKAYAFVPGFGAYILSYVWIGAASLVLTWRTARAARTAPPMVESARAA